MTAEELKIFIAGIVLGFVVGLFFVLILVSWLSVNQIQEDIDNAEKIKQSDD